MNIDHLTIAAFIAAGMHLDVEKLDKARDCLDTGCFELVQSAVRYTEYADKLFSAGKATTDDIPGVFEYEVCEEFGNWYLQETLDTNALPDVERATYELIRLTLNFFYGSDPSSPCSETRDRLVQCLAAVAQPEQPEL